MKYRRIFPVESLSKVENPWKEITLNRCILVAMVIVAVSSGIEKVQEVLEPYFEETEELELEIQPDELSEESFSWLDTVAIWNWKSEDKIDEFKKKRAARLKLAVEKTEPRKIRNKALDEGLLKEREQSRIIPVIVQ